RVNFQFMVKVECDQSVSITPSRPTMPSFGELVGPRTMRFQPGGVLNRKGRPKGSTPLPSCERLSDVPSPYSVSTFSPSIATVPSQVARILWVDRMSHPSWLAITI